MSGGFRRLITGALLALAAMLSSAPVLAQGFMVKPIRMEVSAWPSQSIQIPLEVRNTALDGPRRIQFRVVELSQDVGGSWKLVEPGTEGLSEGHASALGWTELSVDTLDIAPSQPAEVMVTLTPPANARGAYFAGIIAETPLPEQTVGVVIRTRFLIPLIVLIEGRTVRQRVQLDDVGMEYVTGEQGIATTNATLKVVNGGQTFSRVSGEIRVESNAAGVWRTVTKVPVPELGIIPGMTLMLGGDLERRLPTGEYRLQGELQVDGRRIAPITKLVDFVGSSDDPLAFDTSMVLTPSRLEMIVVPGATRTNTLRVENSGLDPVTVRLSAETPVSLRGVAMGSITGNDLSAQAWTTIQPSEFTIRPNGSQNVRIISELPDDGIVLPNYYADLIVKGVYADGQSAGETRSMMRLSNQRVEPSPQGAIESVDLAEMDQSRFAAKLVFVNIGNIDYTTSGRVSLLTPQGREVSGAQLHGDAAELLPLGRRTLSGEMDFAAVAAGDYVLLSTVRMASGGEVTKQKVVRVEIEEFTSADGSVLSVPRVAVLGDVPNV